MARLSEFLRNLFSFLSTRSSKEERLSAYVIREHERGRPLTEILGGPVRSQPGDCTGARAPARPPRGDPRARRDERRGRAPETAQSGPPEYSGSTGHFRRTDGQSPHVLMTGVASDASELWPPPRARRDAARSASEPAATSHAARPFDLNTTMSSVDLPAGQLPATTSCSSCTSSQSRTPASTGSIRSPDSRFACFERVAADERARSRTALSSSRRRGSFAPTAQTSAPGLSHSPRRTGRARS